jgi:fatty acid desaturase
MSETQTAVPVPGLPEDFQAGEPLPNPMLGGKDALSPEGKKEIKTLSGPRPGRFLFELGLNWAVIGVTMWTATWINNLWFYLFVIYFIGTRQNILGLLIHEQTHYLCSRKRWGDAVTNLFAAWPIVVVSIEGYAKIHLAHHSYYFSENDPDFIRKNGKEWTFPMKVRFLCWLFFKDAIGGTFIALLTGKKEPSNELISRPAVFPMWVRLLYYAVIIGLSVWLGFWELLLLLWVVPLLLVLPVIVRFSAICEHKYNVLGGKLEESTATIILSWWERMLLPRLHFNYHIYHHYYPGIAFSNLPKVHALFEKEGLVNKDNLFGGYLAYFRRLLN